MVDNRPTTTSRFTPYDPISTFQAFVKKANAMQDQRISTTPVEQLEITITGIDFDALGFSEEILELDSMDIEEIGGELEEELTKAAGVSVEIPKDKAIEIPARELEKEFDELAVLLRYGHRVEVGRRLSGLLDRFPGDLLLHRQVAEFFVAHDMKRGAAETLFRLANIFLVRKQYAAIKQVVEQILVLDKDNEQANRLMALLPQS